MKITRSTSHVPSTVRGLVTAATTSMVVLQTGRQLAGAVRSRRLARMATLGAGAYFLFQAFRSLQTAVADRAQAQREDEALDSRIDDTFPASDATATY